MHGCYSTLPITTTFFWFSISSLCVHYNVYGCSAMLLSLLQPPSSGSLSVPCVSATMSMVALLRYCPSYTCVLLEIVARAAAAMFQLHLIVLCGVMN